MTMVVTAMMEMMEILLMEEKNILENTFQSILELFIMLIPLIIARLMMTLQMALMNIQLRDSLVTTCQ